MEPINLARIRAKLGSTESTTSIDLAEYERQQQERLARLAEEHERQTAAYLTAAALERSGMARAVQEKTFANFVANSALQRAMKHKAEAYVANHEGRWFFVGGQSGSGKTHICTAIVGGLSARGKRCRYMAWREEYPRFAGLLNTPDYSRELNAAKRVEVLYIDDLFKRAGMDNGMPTDGEIKLAYELLNHRALNYLSTIISTEYTQDQLIAIDEATGGRIAEMAKDYAISISKDRAKNYRLRRC